MSSVSSMDPVGITKACTSVVVPKSSRMMVTVHSAIKPRIGRCGASVSGCGSSASMTSSCSCSTDPYFSGILLSCLRLHSSTLRRSILLVFSCTILGAAAQILMKIGMTHFTPTINGLLTNIPLLLGYALYGINTVMLVLALQHGQLSMLYPIIALTYVWVTLLSYGLLHEQPNWYKNAGITIIVAGVAVLGRGQQSATPLARKTSKHSKGANDA